MAEISYPYGADSSGGGQQMVSQNQWQYMAAQFAYDRVDFPIGNTALTNTDLPFNATVANGAVSIAPGRALVGGFYYQLTAAQTVSIAPNTSSLGRIDLITIRTDLAKGSTNLYVIQGQPAASPKAPLPSRTYGGAWDLPLHLVNVPASGGTLTLTNVMPFSIPETVAVPWNASSAASLQRGGTFILDMDSNNTDTQTEYFNGRDGYVVTRDLGKRRAYTPTLTGTTGDEPTTSRTGRWRWIAPGMVWFSVNIRNDNAPSSKTATKVNSTLRISLPRPAAAGTGQIIHGRLDNPKYNGGLPNSIDITAVINKSSGAQTVAYLWYPDPNNPKEGLNVLNNLPLQSNLVVSGVYETDTFGN